MFVAPSIYVVSHSTPQTLNNTMVGHIDREVYQIPVLSSIIRPRIDNCTRQFTKSYPNIADLNLIIPHLIESYPSNMKRGMI